MVFRKMLNDRLSDFNRLRKPFYEGLQQLDKVAEYEEAGEVGLCYSAKLLDLLRVQSMRLSLDQGQGRGGGGEYNQTTE